MKHLYKQNKHKSLGILSILVDTEKNNRKNTETLVNMTINTNNLFCSYKEIKTSTY